MDRQTKVKSTAPEAVLRLQTKFLPTPAPGAPTNVVGSLNGGIGSSTTGAGPDGGNYLPGIDGEGCSISNGGRGGPAGNFPSVYAVPDVTVLTGQGGCGNRVSNFNLAQTGGNGRVIIEY